MLCARWEQEKGIDLAILDIYKKVGGVPIEDFDSTTTNKIRNYEEIKQYLQID